MQPKSRTFESNASTFATKKMKTDNTMVYIIAAVVIAHFVIGIGLLIYKMSTPSKKKSEEKAD